MGCQKKDASRDLPKDAVPLSTGDLPSAMTKPVPTPSPIASAAAPLLRAFPSFAPIAKAADPAVVTIHTVTGEVESRGVFARGRKREAKGLGTGFIVDKDGTILTNHHVVEGVDAIVVRLSSGHPYEARVTGRDPSTDIAVVKIQAKEPLFPVHFGDSDALEVGDWVVAIGNPFGLDHTVSAGIVSAKGRTNEDVQLDQTGYYNFLQTDASINPGNSGGPLLNLSGEVVGINTAIRGDGAQGIGFAIPINMVKQLLPGLLRDGKVTRSALGITIRDVRELLPDQKSELGYAGEEGAAIAIVEPGSGAEKAGLAPKDVIIGFEGTNITRGSLLQWLAATSGVGKTVTVRAVRGGKPFEVKVTLGQLKERPTRKKREED